MGDKHRPDDVASNSVSLNERHERRVTESAVLPQMIEDVFDRSCPACLGRDLPTGTEKVVWIFQSDGCSIPAAKLGEQLLDLRAHSSTPPSSPAPGEYYANKRRGESRASSRVRL